MLRGILIAILLLAVIILALATFILLIICIALLGWIRDHDIEDPFGGRDKEYFDRAVNVLFNINE